jgi:hypothetical protein
MCAYNFTELDIANFVGYFPPKNTVLSQAWWYRSVTQLLRRQRQVDHEFRTSLGKVSETLSLIPKGLEYMVQVVEHLCSKLEVLGSISNTGKKITFYNGFKGCCDTKLLYLSNRKIKS